MGKKIVHVEFPAQDTDRAEKFWEGVGGWSIEDAGMPGMDYRMFQDEGWGGAVYPTDGSLQGPVVYLGSDDIEADIAKVRELGGGGGEERARRPGDHVRGAANRPHRHDRDHGRGQPRNGGGHRPLRALRAGEDPVPLGTDRRRCAARGRRGALVETLGPRRLKA